MLATEKWLGQHELLVIDAAWEQPIEDASEGRPIDVSEPAEDNEDGEGDENAQ